MYRCDGCEEYYCSSDLRKYCHPSGWNCFVCADCSYEQWAEFKKTGGGDRYTDFLSMCSAFPEYLANKVYDVKRGRKRKYAIQEEDELVSALANLSIKRRRAS